jgi:hypothetical protein
MARSITQDWSSAGLLATSRCAFVVLRRSLSISFRSLATTGCCQLRGLSKLFAVAAVLISV